MAYMERLGSIAAFAAGHALRARVHVHIIGSIPSTRSRPGAKARFGHRPGGCMFTSIYQDDPGIDIPMHSPKF